MREEAARRELERGGRRPSGARQRPPRREAETAKRELEVARRGGALQDSLRREGALREAQRDAAALRSDMEALRASIGNEQGSVE
jgi:hypothetical protein